MNIIPITNFVIFMSMTLLFSYCQDETKNDVLGRLAIASIVYIFSMYVFQKFGGY